MADDLVSMAQGYLTNDVIQQAASFVGETPGNVGKAVGGIVPTILTALQRVAGGTDGPTRLARLVDGSGRDGNVLGRVPELFRGGAATQETLGSGQEVLGTLLGDKAGPVANEIASTSGIRPSSATSLLALITPLILAMLGQQRMARGLNPTGLASLVTGQTGWGRLVPAGVGTLLGLGGLAGVGSGIVSMVKPSAVTVIPDPRRRLGWLIPLVVLAALGLGLWAYTQNHTTARIPSVAAMATVALPGGNSLSVAPNSFNYNLAQYLASTTDTTVPKTFIFDNLNFETGTTTLTPESQPTVTNLIAILKAYPATQVRLDGYTDNTGSPEANQKLSLDRAEAVKAMLVNGGIDADRLTTAGHGQDNPVASNDTEEGKAKNRRLELVVVKK
jgi:OmpA-OmpF porin, OOP family